MTGKSGIPQDQKLNERHQDLGCDRTQEPHLEKVGLNEDDVRELHNLFQNLSGEELQQITISSSETRGLPGKL